VARADVIGLDEVLQKLQGRWFKGLILTIGLRVIGNRNQGSEMCSVHTTLKKTLNGLDFHSITFKKEKS